MKYAPNPFRTYSQEDVQKLRGSFNISHTLAQLGANRAWLLFNTLPYIKSLGAYTGLQAVQAAKAGLQSIYISGWMCAADNNRSFSSDTYPDISLYPCNSVPEIVKRINSALLAADRIEVADKGAASRYYMLPILGDIEAGFGNPLNVFEITKSMIEAGSGLIHLEDQTVSGSGKRCGHLGSKVLVPTKTFVKKLIASRLAMDICGTPTVLIARTDAESAGWIESDADEYDHPFIDFDKRNDDGFYALKGDPMDRCIARAIAYGKHSDAIWMETSTPNLQQAKQFADAVHSVYKDKLLAYNCSPSFNWKKHLSDRELLEFQDRLGEMGYRYQFITLAGYHTNAMSSFKLASDYNERGMAAYSDIQQEEFQMQTSKGYTAIKHQAEVGTNFYDAVRTVIDGNSNMSANTHSTEAHQF